MENSILVRIRGLSPLLMHAFPMVAVEAEEKKKPAEQAALHVYRDEETGELHIPGVAIQRCLVAAAAYSKGKGRATLSKPVAASVMVDPERCLLGTKTYKIDSRPVVMPATRGRIMRHRARLDQWEVSFTLFYDPDLLTEDQLRRVVDDAGRRCGLLDFRPEKKGSFGRFAVVSWAEADGSAKGIA